MSTLALRNVALVFLLALTVSAVGCKEKVQPKKSPSAKAKAGPDAAKPVVVREAPDSEAPKGEQPKSDVPKGEEPKSDVPKGEEPAKSQPAGQPNDGSADRASIEDKHKWDLTPLFKDDAAFDAALGKNAEARTKIAEFKGQLADAAKLRECLTIYFEAARNTNRAHIYAKLRFDTAQKDTKAQALQDNALKAVNELMSVSSFIRQAILKLDDEVLKKGYAADEKLAAFRPYIDELRRRKKRVLGAEAEKVLSLAGDNLWAEIDLNELPSDLEKAYAAIRTELPMPMIADENGQQVQLSFSNYGKYRASKVRSVRKAAVEGFFGALRKFQRSFAATLGGQMRHSVFLARARGYDTALDAYLDKDNIDPQVYKSLISAVHANLEPLHRYVELRKKAMKLDDIYIYDLYAPMVESVPMQFTYDQALEMLPKALAPLGEDYQKLLAKAIDPKNRWIDVYPHKDKDSGAFVINTYDVHPYVKMNYFGEVDDVSTLAHELGHAIHSYLADENQPYITSRYAPFNAEIASTLNEKLLSSFLLANAKSDAEKLRILSELTERIRLTIYRQTLFAEFELLGHTAAEEGKPLTAEFFNKAYEELIRKYYGPGFSMGKDDPVEWAFIPHFYYKYYVFVYATGLSSGIALAEAIEKEGEKARDAYLGMLKGGSSKPPVTLLKDAGVDLTKPETFAAAARLFSATMEEMDKLLGK